MKSHDSLVSLTGKLIPIAIKKNFEKFSPLKNRKKLKCDTCFLPTISWLNLDGSTAYNSQIRV